MRFFSWTEDVMICRVSKGQLATLFAVSIVLLYFAYNYQGEVTRTSSTYEKKDLNYDVHKPRVFKASFPSVRKQALKKQRFKPLTIHIQRQASFDYEAAMDKLNEKRVAQDDPKLIELIRNYYIVPPSKESYNLTKDKLDYSKGQTPIIDSMMNYTEGGFYVECGACDGEWISNTLFFEKVRKWNGVLIEADPFNFENLLRKHRKAFLVNACLSTKPYPSKMLFRPKFSMGKLVQNDVNSTNSSDVVVQCFPLYSILLALNQLKVDFLSLDVEGFELDIIETIPFERVDIQTMTVEFSHVPGGEEALKSVVSAKGFTPQLLLARWDRGANDIIFTKTI